MNGILIDIFEAPTSLIISISLFLEYIASLIVLAIKNAVTRTNDKTATIHIFFTTLNTSIN